MRKHVFIILLVLLGTSLFVGLTYTWFTYVHRKSLATFTSNEIEITAEINEHIVIDTITLDNLSFIDYQNDLIENQSLAFDEMAASIEIKIFVSQSSPLSKHRISLLTSNHPELIYLIVFDGKNMNETTGFSHNYYDKISVIIDNIEDKQEQLNAIALHNENTLNSIYDTITLPGDILFLQIAVWGDYDAVIDQSHYMNQTFSFVLTMDSYSSKAEVNEYES